MPRTLPAGTIAALASGTVDVSVFVRIQTPSTTIRITTTSAATTFKSELYLPATFGDISAVTEGDNMAESGVSFSFSGLEYDLLQTVALTDFLNSPVSIWALFSGGGNSGEMLLFDGFTSGAPSIEFGRECGVVVSCQGKFAALNRPRSLRYTDAQQQAKYPNDKGMEYSAQVASREIIWPAAQWFKNNS